MGDVCTVMRLWVSSHPRVKLPLEDRGADGIMSAGTHTQKRQPRELGHNRG